MYNFRWKYLAARYRPSVFCLFLICAIGLPSLLQATESESKTSKTPGIEKNGSLGESQYWINQGIKTRTQLYSKAINNNDFELCIAIEKQTLKAIITTVCVSFPQVVDDTGTKRHPNLDMFKADSHMRLALAYFGKGNIEESASNFKSFVGFVYTSFSRYGEEENQYLVAIGNLMQIANINKLAGLDKLILEVIEHFSKDEFKFQAQFNFMQERLIITLRSCLANVYTQSGKFIEGWDEVEKAQKVVRDLYKKVMGKPDKEVKYARHMSNCILQLHMAGINSLQKIAPAKAIPARQVLLITYKLYRDKFKIHETRPCMIDAKRHLEYFGHKL